MCDEKAITNQKTAEKFNAYLDNVGKTSKMSKSAFNLAKAYGAAMEYHPDRMNARTFLNFLSEVDFKYSAGIMATSIIRGAMQKHFNVSANAWGMTTHETNVNMLDCLNWENEAAVFIDDQEWMDYEEVIKDLWYKEGYRTESLFKEYVKNAFMWNGLSPKEFNRLSKADVTFHNNDELIIKNDIRFHNEFLGIVFKHVVTSDEIFRTIFKSQFKIREGRTKRFFEERLRKGNHIMKSSPLNIYYSGEMYRHAKYGKTYQIDTEWWVAYYLRIEQMKYVGESRR